MRSLFTKLAGLALTASVLLTACEKEGDNVTLNQTSAPELKASTSTPVLSKDDAAKPAVTYTWTPAEYGFAAAPTYSLDFDVKGNNFKAPKTITVGAGVTSYTLTVAELNTLLTDLGQKAGTEGQLEVRLKAALNSADAFTMSGIAPLKATPYESRELPKDTWAVIGSATPGSWDKDTPMTYDFDRKVWVVTLPLTAAEFKFRANGAWTLNLGDAGIGDATAAGRQLVYNVAPTPNPPNLIAPATVGMYTITLNTNATPKPTYTIRPM